MLRPYRPFQQLENLYIIHDLHESYPSNRVKMKHYLNPARQLDEPRRRAADDDAARRRRFRGSAELVPERCDGRRLGLRRWRRDGGGHRLWLVCVASRGRVLR